MLGLPNVSACPDYDQWHYGFSGSFTPYVAANLVRSGRTALFQAYAARDVVYLMGQNDTCNEHLTPDCQSHGLDKSCGGMLEGSFRRERAQNYVLFLNAFFGRPSVATPSACWCVLAGRVASRPERERARGRVHSATLVPGVGHDHTNMFQSAQVRLPPAFVRGLPAREG